MATDVFITPASGTIDFNNGVMGSVLGTIATMKVYDSLTTGNLSIQNATSGVRFLNRANTGNIFEAYGTYGNLFTVSDDLTDSIFSVNTSAGVPVLDVYSNNSVYAGQYNANDFVINSNKVGIGTKTFTYTINDNTRLVGSNTNNKLFINGSVQLLNDNDAIVIGRGTATFLSDEELGFGWGGGWYMTDGTYLRVRNNKTIYSAGEIWGAVFKDSNNTAYYVDPASTGYSAYFAGAIQATKIGIEDGGIDCYMEITDANPVIYGVTYGGEFIFYGDKSTPASFLYYGGATVTYTLQANSSLRAPIFYDSDNTGYYIDPNGASSINTITSAQYYTTGWFRNNSSGNGLYNESTGEHFYSDAGDMWNVASANGTQGIRLRTGGHNGTIRGYFYGNDSNDIGLLNNGGNWRVRVVGGDYVLFDGSSARAQVFYDSNDTTYYTDPAGTSYLNYSIFNGLSSSDYTRQFAPSGGYFYAGGAQTGAIKIRMPANSKTLYPMLSFTCHIYNYSTGTSRTFKIGGHFSNSSWYNTFAYCLSESAGNLNVRWGYEGNYLVVWIGETTSGWSYPCVFITDFQNGYSAINNSWMTGWNVSLVTAFDTVTNGPTAAGFFWNQNNDGSGSGLDADLVDGLDVHAGRNDNANKIVRTDSNGYIQAGWINTTSGDNGTTALDRIYASSDAYIRYYTPANFRTVLDVPTRAGSGASGSWGISITGNAATVSNGVYTNVNNTLTGINYFTSNLGTTSGSLSNPPLQAYASGTNAAFMSFHRGGSYAVNMGLDSDNVLRIGGWSASANRLQLDMSGNLTLAGVVDATQFRDSANTSYYIDPASTSNLVGLTVANTITGSITGNAGGSSASCTGNAATATRTSSQSGYPHAGTGMFAFYNWGGSDGGTSAPSASTYTTGLSVGSNPGDQAYGFQIANNMWNTGLWTRNYNSGFGSWIRLLDSSNYVGYSAFTGNVDGTQFRDANNTAYYIDPASTSNLVGLTVANTITGAVSGNAGSVTINYNNDSNSTYQMLWGSGNNVYGTAGVYLNPSTDVLYANAFYDAGNTAYYLDPNSTSNLLLVKTRNTFGERIAVTAASSTTIDTQYNVTELTMSTNVSLTLSNIQSSGTVHMWTIVTVGNGTAYSIGWPAAIKWPGGTAPTITSTNTKRDIYQFVTYDGGTTIYAIIVGQNL